MRVPLPRLYLGFTTDGDRPGCPRTGRLIGMEWLGWRLLVEVGRGGFARGDDPVPF